MIKKKCFPPPKQMAIVRGGRSCTTTLLSLSLSLSLSLCEDVIQRQNDFSAANEKRALKNVI